MSKAGNSMKSITFLHSLWSLLVMLALASFSGAQSMNSGIAWNAPQIWSNDELNKAADELDKTTKEVTLNIIKKIVNAQNAKNLFIEYVDNGNYGSVLTRRSMHLCIELINLILIKTLLHLLLGSKIYFHFLLVNMVNMNTLLLIKIFHLNRILLLFLLQDGLTGFLAVVLG